jgi:prolyl oligopeptidase
MRFASFLTMSCLAAAAVASDVADDPYLWLEDVGGERALAWVHRRNAEAEKRFAADPRFETLREEFRQILDSDARIPYVVRMGGHYYNFWQDATNPRGLWRRTPLAEYRKPAPRWETVLDLDALAQAENENWVWKGAECLRPAAPRAPYEHCMIALSRGGADATVQREFDLRTKTFVKGGFDSAEAKQDIVWRDHDSVWIGTDFGSGSMTTSGYPRVVKLWKRGTPLPAARTVFEGQANDVGVGALVQYGARGRSDWIQRDVSFWQHEYFVVRDGMPVKLDVPADSNARMFGRWLLVRTRSPWTVGARTYPAQSLLAIDFDAFLRNARDFDVLYEAGPRNALVAVNQTQSAVLVSELDNVRARLWEIRYDGKHWQRTRVELPDNAQIDVATTYWASDDYLVTVQDFTTPTMLSSRSVGRSKSEPLKSLPRFFDATGLQTQQFEATSRDGTRIPYFVVKRADLALNGGAPTLLYGYGGFENAELPWYSGTFGKGWLEPGGVFVLANLRGGGEFGPAWHRAAQKENKQRTWDDFAAVAEDLIKRGITQPARLGIMGGSQGGLLVTTTLVQRPELFGAVVAQVPLADMLRYHKLLAGASWIDEYGDPDQPEQRAYIAKYSPYQNLRKDAKYPPIFLTTSTRDDRVHPAHARKVTARLREYGHQVLYFENTEGGHGAATNNAQRARMWAQAFAFLWETLAPAGGTTRTAAPKQAHRRAASTE